MPLAKLLSRLAITLVATALGLAAASARIPLPHVEGPVATTAASHPFLGAAWQAEPTDLAAHGYVEEEYFLAGKANVYEYAPDKSLRVLRSGAPYVNRILVRRPKDMRRFNGRALVEMLNASAGPDISFQWSSSHDFLMANGYVYVGVTSKPYAVERLKQFDPARYGRLSWANPAPQAGCDKPGPWAQFPGWSTNATEDGLLWDIVSQLGALLKSNDPSNPLRTAPARRLYLAGHSQSGGYVGTYARDFQLLARTAKGAPIYDGFMQTGSAGLSTLNQCAKLVDYEDPHIVMRSAMPFVRIMTLTDFYDYTPLITNYRLRDRPDSDSPGDLFRLYEIAGAEHSTAALYKYGAAAPADIERAGGKAMTRSRCMGTANNDFPLGLAYDAALEALDRWRDGVPAPRATRIEMDRPGDPAAAAVRDAHGNVQGGFRTPVIDVPVAAYFGKSNVPPPKTEACRNKGYSLPFDEQTLRALYPTHDAYVSNVRSSVARLTAARFLTKTDGERLVREAASSAMP